MKTENLSFIFVIICVVMAIQLKQHIWPKVEETVATKKILERLEEYRLFRVIFRHHPEAKEELEYKFANIYAHSPSDKVSFDSRMATAEIVNRYFDKHLVAASDEVTYKMIVSNLEAMKSLSDRLQLCVDYYLGQLNIDSTEIADDFLKRELDWKADIIESAIQSPSLPPKADNIDGIAEVLAIAYNSIGSSIENLANLDSIGQIPPDEGCATAIEFNSALATLDEKKASYIYKNLLYIGKEEE